MTQEEISELILCNLFDLLPELETEPISLDKEIEDMGVSPNQREEIIDMTLESLGIECFHSEFISARSIRELGEQMFQLV